MLVFEKDATFELNLANTRSSTDRNNGGALSNNAKGTIVFKGKLTVTDNKAQVKFSARACRRESTRRQGWNISS